MTKRFQNKFISLENEKKTIKCNLLCGVVGGGVDGGGGRAVGWVEVRGRVGGAGQ